MLRPLEIDKDYRVRDLLTIDLVIPDYAREIDTVRRLNVTVKKGFRVDDVSFQGVHVIQLTNGHSFTVSSIDQVVKCLLEYEIVSEVTSDKSEKVVELDDSFSLTDLNNYIGTEVTSGLVSSAKKLALGLSYPKDSVIRLILDNVIRYFKVTREFSLHKAGECIQLCIVDEAGVMLVYSCVERALAKLFVHDILVEVTYPDHTVKPSDRKPIVVHDKNEYVEYIQTEEVLPGMLDKDYRVLLDFVLLREFDDDGINVLNYTAKVHLELVDFIISCKDYDTMLDRLHKIGVLELI